MTSPTALRAGLATICAVGLMAAVAVPASAGPTPTACTMVRPSEYRAVLGKSVRLTTGEGTSSCNVWYGATNSGIIPNLNPNYPAFAGFMKKMLATTPSKVRQPGLGGYGWAVSFTGGGKSVYAGPTKRGLIVQFQAQGATSLAQLIRLAKLAYPRV
jgi:hypothetical protein